MPKKATMEIHNGNSLASEYLNGLREAYIKAGEEEAWGNMMQIATGASGNDLQALKAAFPDVPDSLIDILRRIDGTYFRKYAGGTVSAYVLGSDIDNGEYPYYLLSAKEMVDDRAEITDLYSEFVDRDFDEDIDDIAVDDRIISDAKQMNWLHFSDCMNNGGTSRLFIDFSPSEKGKKGQIVRYLHDPDELWVIADSFDEYLQMIIDNGYAFVM